MDIRCTCGSGRRSAGRAGRSWCCTAFRATGAGITGWGARSPRRDTAASFPDRRGSGANARDRGHARSARRLNLDLVEWLRALRTRAPRAADRAGRDQLGRKTRGDRRGPAPRAGRRPGADLPGPSPPRRRFAQRASRDRLGVSSRIGERPSRSRSRTPRFSRTTRRARPSSPPTRSVSAKGRPGLLAASFIIDRLVARAPARIRQPALLMLAGQDRIVDNARTLAYFERLASTEAGGDRISRGPPHPGIRP